MRRIVAVLCLAALAAPAFAQVDPDSNSSGIYYDEGANDYCTLADVGSTVTAYLCLTRTSSTSGIGFWEATVEMSPGATIMAYNLRGSAVNAAVAPKFVVTLSEPLPQSTSIVALEMEIRIDEIHPVALRIHPADTPSYIPDGAAWPLPVYSPGDDPGSFQVLGYSYGWEAGTGIPNWCSIINPVEGSCPSDPLPERAGSWGAVKALYR